MKKQILILSGPTHEYIDPVRFIGNASSGKMGKALAEEAAQRGCEVEFVTGPVAEENLPRAGNIHIHKVVGAEEMLSKARKLFQSSEAIIFAAAVADYAPAEKLGQKMAKSTEGLVLHLRPTPDIAQTLCEEKKNGQVAIGFALQTEEGRENARRKLAKKNLDGIVLNTPATLGANDGTFSYLAADAEAFEEWGRIGKTDCARRILDAAERQGRLKSLPHN
jgi:phosphopantothenoylcysteine decarboxylase/phosphopantothenate--cysteine ligase